MATTNDSAIVLGGGLSGAATAYALASAGWQRVTVIEAGHSIGGLAGSFEQDGRFYPLGYHHILHRDRVLLFFLEKIGALADVRWRRIRMLFEQGGRLHDLGSPLGFLRFPMAAADKARFVRLMLRSFRKTDWSDWEGRSAAELIDSWGGPGVRTSLFESLSRLKFDLPCEAVSAAWLGARLYFREGSAPLGYIPGTNWTKVLCDGVASLLKERGVAIRLRSPVRSLHRSDGAIREVELQSGERVGGDLFVSTIPTEVYSTLAPDDETAEIRNIRYTAIVSAICATRQKVSPDFYWLNLASLTHSAGGLFQLNSLNPTAGGGDTCLNFITHLPSRSSSFFTKSDDELLSGYAADFRRLFGFELAPYWTQINRIPMYSPVFVRRYANCPVKSQTWRNLYFAGNYRTFPSIASTGTALGSGLATGRRILEDHGITPSDEVGSLT